MKIGKNTSLFLIAALLIIASVNAGRILSFINSSLFQGAEDLPHVDGMLILSFAILGVGVGVALIAIATIMINLIGGVYLREYIKKMLVNDLYDASPTARIFYYISLLALIVFAATTIVAKFL